MSDCPSPQLLQRDVQEALVASGIFKKTAANVVWDMAESVQPLCFPPRHIVFDYGDAGSCFYLIASGKVKLAYRCGDGREIVVNVAGTGDMFGEVAAFDRGPREFTAITVTHVRAIEVERDQLIAWAIAFPEIGQQIMRLLARRVNVMASCLADFAFADPAHRLATRFLLLGARFGRREGDVVRVKLDLTLEETSQFAGVAAGDHRRDAARLWESRMDPFRRQLPGDVDAEGLAAFRAGQ